MSRTSVAIVMIKIAGAIVCGFITFVVITLGVVLAARDSWFASQWHRVFGLAPLLASTFDPNWFEGEGLVPANYPSTVVGERIAGVVFIGSWTLLFCALYLLLTFGRSRTSNKSLEPTADRRM